MKLRKIFMFSGQGSQYYHMGKELYQKHPRFRYWMDYCDSIVRPHINTSLIDKIYYGPGRAQPFDQLIYSNPALVSIEYSLSKVLEEMDCQPDYLMGYSLGEITACIVSGAVSLEEGMHMVCNIAYLVVEHCQAVEMMVVISSMDITREIPDLFECCQITGSNFPGNFVVSGLPGDIQRLNNELTKRQVLTQVLPVKYGFHTHMIDSIKDAFIESAQDIVIQPFAIPVISTLTPEVIQAFNVNYIWDVIRNPIQFDQSVKWMISQGDFAFIDVGPSGSLATFVKYILPAGSRSSFVPVLNPFGKDLQAIEELTASLAEANIPKMFV